MLQADVLDRWVTRVADGALDVFHSPRFWGLEHLRLRRPMLLVGNHTVYGLQEAAVLWLRVFVECGIRLRTVSAHFHFRFPIWREVLTHFGGFDGTPENCARLLAAGECLLVHPGGEREVAKRKGEKYRLMWKKRYGFIRLAIQQRCPIVTVAAVGGEDLLDIVLDGDEVLAALPPVAALVDRIGLRRELIIPLTRGVGPTPIPRPERLYFKLSAPIDPTPYGDGGNLAKCRELRNRVQRELEDGIAFLRRERARDPERTLFGRLRGQIRGRTEPAP